MKAPRLFAIVLFSAALAGAQNVPAQLVVTVEGAKGHEAPTLTAGDITFHDGKKNFHVDELLPLRGEHAGAQLAILIDDGSDPVLGLQFDDLRRFIREQPESTQIGIYYIRNGSPVAAQPMSADHEAAAGHLRLPIGQPGAAVSPSQAISELIKKWPAAQPGAHIYRREILLISSGNDLYRGIPSQNPYLETAIADARRANVQVNSIYFAGRGGREYNFGRDYLCYLGDETGGEAYWEGLATSVSFRPYLDDLTTRLKHQYLVTLSAEPQKKGRFERIRLHAELPQVDLAAADQIWIPAEK